MDSIIRDIPNVFAKANFSFLFAGKTHSYVNQFYSAYGLSGLHWNVCDPRSIVGQSTEVTLDMLTGLRRRMKLPGSFTAERSKGATYLGVRFNANADDAAALVSSISSAGTVPTTHLRKYPRIPASEFVATMPLNVIINYNGDLITARVANISPNGILICTENPKAALMDLDNRVKMQLEPRGEFYLSINLEGMVCRILEDLNPASKNVLRYIGMRITRFDEGHREAFISLLQDILLRLKIAGERQRS